MSGGNSTRAWAGGPRDSEHIFLTKIDIHRVINIRSQKFFRCMDSPNPSTDRGGTLLRLIIMHARAGERKERRQQAGSLARPSIELPAPHLPGSKSLEAPKPNQ